MNDLISRRIAETDVVLCLGDVTAQTTDAIVNAASSARWGRGRWGDPPRLRTEHP